MKDRSTPCDLVDRDGLPFSGELAQVLRRLGPRLLREFPSLSDEAELADVLEETGRRLRERDADGEIRHLLGFARVTARHVALSRLRKHSHQIRLRTVSSEESASMVAVVEDACRTDDHVELNLLLRQAMRHLTSLEATVCRLKIAGYSSREIAHELGCSPDAVNSAYCRAKTRLRALLTSC